MKHLFLLIAFCHFAFTSYEQVINCTLPESFREFSSSWKQGGEVNADLSRANVLNVRPGTGVLINISNDKSHGEDLFTRFEHGDADIEFDYLLAKGANSGVYLQGRYEVQLFDSWGKAHVSSSDNGGIYERWDENKPDGQKGYLGIAPRQNVSRAPGLWQHMKISFVAPKFDAGGRKIENARITRVELNGVVIHDNVELSGVTRGAAGEEQAKGSLRIQGDHGSVAFRNFTLTPYDKQRPRLTDIHYSIYRGVYRKEPDYRSVSPEAQGTQDLLSVRINNLPDTFLLHYAGTIDVKEAGNYKFRITTMNGNGLLRINNKTVTTITEENNDAVTNLPAGNLPFELVFTKVQNWGSPSINITVSGPGFREFTLSDADDISADVSDPILVAADGNTVLRSFMDIPGKRVIHAVSVGSPENMHYTYDMDCGALVQVWRGGFLDATPMWHERGDGSSRPTGAVLRFGSPSTLLGRLSNNSAFWKSDTVGAGFRPKGYFLDDDNRPVFRYHIAGASVTDAIIVAENNTGFKRQINVSNSGAGIYARLAADERIEQVSEGLFLIGDHDYYIRLEDNQNAATVRSIDNKKEIIVPVTSKLVYSILF